MLKREILHCNVNIVNKIAWGRGWAPSYCDVEALSSGEPTFSVREGEGGGAQPHSIAFGGVFSPLLGRFKFKLDGQSLCFAIFLQGSSL